MALHYLIGGVDIPPGPGAPGGRRPDIREAFATYREAMESLPAVLGNESASPELGAALREVVVPVIVHPTQAGEPMNIEINGRWAALTRDDSPSINDVAGAGFEPAAFRL